MKQNQKIDYGFLKSVDDYFVNILCDRKFSNSHDGPHCGRMP